MSVKLTQMGMDLDPQLAEQIVREMTEHARATGSFVRVDMEGSEYTQATIDMVRRIHAEPGNEGHVGTVIQAYLYRSRKDIESLNERGIRVRLCKGAYLEPASVAFPKKAQVDQNYIELMQLLLDKGKYPAIATHDEKMIEATKAYVKAHNISRDAFEFQMLYGIRRDLQRQLAKEGYRVRIYVPFGKAWYPYYMRRLAERPANVIFLAKNVLKSSSQL